MFGKFYIPHPALQEFVLDIGTVDITLPEEIEQVTTPYPPTPHQSLMFYGDDRISTQKADWDHFELQPPVLIVGPQYTRVNILVTRRLKVVRVDFRPGGLHRLLGIPMSILFDDSFNAYDIFGPEMQLINEQLLNTADDEVRKSIVEGFLLAKRKQLKLSCPFDAAIRVLIQTGGNISMEQLASLACLSLRQLDRKCMERIGMLPKVFARIVRFSKAYRLKEANLNLSWTAIAHEAGYFDQTHFIRDFKEFAGVTPRIIEKAILETPFQMQADLLV
jgi:AraC-like DNA-binding protein